MKASKLRETGKEELQQQCEDFRKELMNLRVRKSTGQVEQPSRIRVLRRDIARALTVLNEPRNP